MPLDDHHTLVPAPPTVEEYLALRHGAGLSRRTEAQASGALAGSWAFCHVICADVGRPVAMARVVGDGGWYFQVADVATAPDHRRRGLGRAVLEHLLAEIARRAPAHPYVTLLADPPGRHLYERLGFVPTAPGSIGMVLRETPAP